MKKIIAHTKGLYKYFIVGPLFKLFEAILELILPLFMRLLIDRGIVAKNSSFVLKSSGIMLIISILGLLCALVCQYAASIASQRFGTKIRQSLYQKISNMSKREVEGFGEGSLLTRITSDADQLQKAVAMLIRLVIRAPFICIGSIAITAWLSPSLSLILLCATPVFVFIIFFAMKKSLPIFKQAQLQLDHIGNLVRENMSGVRVIRAFVSTKREQTVFEKTTLKHSALVKKANLFAAIPNPATMLVMNIAIAIILWFGSFKVSVGSLTAGTMVSFINYAIELISTLVVVAELVNLFSKAYASGLRVESVLESESEIVDGTIDFVSPASVRSPILTFDHVCFAYPQAMQDVLTDIDFRIFPKQKIGLIGGTGSGKSTLVSLLMRHYDIERGKILLNDRSIQAYQLDSLRQNIKLVPQKSMLFSGTVESNLRFGNQQATQEAFENALHVAQADFVFDKLGLATPVMRGGTNFSGGQRQRLCIARALVEKPEILILDDSSSALDFATEAALFAALRAYSAETTLIVVSQRIGSIQDSDQIILLDDGNLDSIGTHAELATSSKLYQEMLSYQFGSATSAS